MHLERTAECSFVLYGVPWSTYEELDRARGDNRRPRIAYLDGNLELIMPGRKHEVWKSVLARLLTVYAEEVELALNAFGSTTYRDRPKAAGLESDECYLIGEDGDVARVPDLALEVSASRSGVNKLEIYRRLGVKEVWLWEHEQILVYRLSGDEYRRLKRSVAIRDIDLDDLARRVVATPPQQQLRVMQTYRKWLQRRR